MTNQEIAYTHYFDQRRKYMLLKRTQLINNLSFLKSYLLAGGNPEDPRIKEIIHVLILELGSEVEKQIKGWIIQEQDNEKIPTTYFQMEQDQTPREIYV